MAGRNVNKKKKRSAMQTHNVSKPSSVVSSSSYYALISRLFAIFVAIVAVQIPWSGIWKLVIFPSNDATSSAKSKPSSQKRKRKQSESTHKCKIFMAKSNIPNSGWGVFTNETIRKNDPVLPPELVLQVPDIPKTEAFGFNRILNDYMWNAAVTGGQFEGKSQTYSVLPGLGMLGNGHLTEFDLVPDQARRHVLTKSLERDHSPLAGAMTQYHGLQHYAYHDIPAGSEIFINYGSGWKSRLSDEAPPKLVDSVELEEDFCLDRMRPGITQDHGYGAVMTHPANAGTVLLPLPVLPIHRSSVEGRLLMNYCFGHQDSDLVLYPYSPMSNYINHDGVKPNAKLQWRTDTEFPSLDSMLNDQPNGLLLELVALRTIENGEQVTIDYGRAWEAAWKQHLEAWKRPNEPYMYPDDPSLTIRTETEQRKTPYAPNLQTVCYRYENRDAIPNRLHKSRLEKCRVLQRTTKDDFLVEFSSDSVQTRLSSQFITFADKPGTSDQALNGAFRQLIGMEDIFPTKWLRNDRQL